MSDLQQSFDALSQTLHRYWYVQNETRNGVGGDNGGVFLGGALEDGFLKAANRDDIEFSLMWANQDWVDVSGMGRNACCPCEQNTA